MLSLTLCCHLISYMSIHPCLNQRGLENDRLRSSSRSAVFKSHFIASMLHVSIVPKGSPSRGGDVAVYVFDINQLSLPTPFYSVLASICHYGPFNCISFHQNSTTLRFLTLFSRSYFCFIGPFNSISPVCKSPSALV